MKHSGDYTKWRTPDGDRAKKCLQATVYFQDQVYVCTCDPQDTEAGVGADIYYHKTCMKSYLIKYDRAKQKHKEEVPSFAKN